MVFVYLPTWERYGNRSYMNDDRERVLAIAQTRSIPLIDLQMVFDAHRDPLSLFPFRKAGHYSEEGNQVVAVELIKFLDHYLTKGVN